MVQLISLYSRKSLFYPSQIKKKVHVCHIVLQLSLPDIHQNIQFGLLTRTIVSTICSIILINARSAAVNPIVPNWTI